MNNEKKRWQKPEMIVLVRNKPEEAVLVVCKLVDGLEAPGVAHESCRGAEMSDICNTNCAAISDS